MPLECARLDTGIPSGSGLDARERARREREIEGGIVSILQSGSTAKVAGSLLAVAFSLVLIAGVAAAAQTAEEEKPESPVWDFDWNNHFKLDRSDGAFKLRFGGRLQTDFAVIGYSGLEDAQDFDKEGFGAEFRRARLFFSGTVYENLVFKVNYDFAGGENRFKDVFVGLRFPEEHLVVLVGHHKQPFSFEGTMSSNNIIFMERPTQGIFLGDRRDTGVTFLYNPTESLNVAAGAYLLADKFGDSPPSGGFGQENDRYAFSGRVTGSPVYEDGGETVLHIGAGYAHWIVGDPDYLPNFDVQPEVHLANDFIRTGDIKESRDVDFVNGEAVSILGPLMLQSEIVGVFISRRNGRSNPNFWGWYGQASYLLTGEHHAYDRKNGIIGHLTPNHNFDPTGGGWGAWEVAARLSYTDASDGNVRGGEVISFTAGLNWYLFPNLRWMLNYVHAHRQGSRGGENGRINAVETRLNFQF
jgi:phosphate-selective porin OprO/OprP